MKSNNYLTHGIHPYHAKFIPSIPKSFLEKYSQPGDSILDPFCGSGTTLLESLLNDRKCDGVDLSVLAYKISRSKCCIVDPQILKNTFENFLNNYDQIDTSKSVDFPNKHIWFNEKTLIFLDKIFVYINTISNEEIKTIFEVVFSSILKTVSNKRETWNNGYIADNVLPNKEYTGDAVKVFTTKMKQAVKAYSDLYALCSQKKNEINVYNQNILDFNPNKKYDMIITSPPYPFAVDFTKYYRLSFYWFGLNVEECAEKETGSRHKRNRANATEEFFIEMEKIYKHLFSLVKRNGYFCMTVADTKRNKQNISFVEWLIKIFTSENWRLVSDDIRTLECQSMGQKRIQQEHMLVFKKEC